MFSVLSRLTKPGDGKKASAPAPMSSSLQKKFAKGVNYNLKILIKGDRNVGKSCLLQRLQGGPFIEEYRPTDQIQVAAVHWTYKATDHIVKVEVWEVVDKGRSKKKGVTGLKLDNAALGPAALDPSEPPPLDATFLDVYKNANGVILMMDITKPWTFDYVQREITGIPDDIPVIILGNHCDMDHHRQIHPHQIEQVITLTKESRSGSVRYAEASMRNGFGLRLLHKFLSVPFLQLQRSTLLAQLAVNQQETQGAHKELDDFQDSDEADYSVFLERLNSKRRQDAPPLQLPLNKSPSIVLGGGKPIIPPGVNPLHNSNKGLSPNKPFLGPALPTTPNQETSPGLQAQVKSNSLQPPQAPSVPQQPAARVQPATKVTAPAKETRPGVPAPLTVAPAGPRSNDDLEDFCAGVLDHSFLDDMSPTARDAAVAAAPQHGFNKLNIDSDSDGETVGNPLVLGFQDDLESADEDAVEFQRNTVTKTASENSNFYSKTSKEPEKRKSSDFTNAYSNSDKVFSPYVESNVTKPLPDIKVEGVRNEGNGSSDVFNKSDKFFFCDGNKADLPSEEDIYDSGPELIRSSAYSSNSMWPAETQIRRSPEGGEDVSQDAEAKKEKESKEEKKHRKSKKSKDKEKSSSDKEKKKSKDKDKKSKEKKSRKKGADDYLEEFLNGTGDAPEAAQEAYETL